MPKEGAHREPLHAPPPGSLVICLDEMGPQSAKSSAGHKPVHAPEPDKPTERARQEIDYGRRGSGYIMPPEERPGEAMALKRTAGRAPCVRAREQSIWSEC